MLDKNVLISCIFIGISVVLYFFYWNRFLARVISLFVRVLYWNREGSRVWFDIGSIHFSLLAGRVWLRGVHYYSGNQTIKIVKVRIQWRYWIRRASNEDELSSPAEEDAKPSFRPLSCRIQISLHGLEWFIYNRTAAYDDIIGQMEKGEDDLNADGRGQHSATYATRPNSTTPVYAPKHNRLRLPSGIRQVLKWFKGQLPSLDPMDLFPIGLEGVTGVIVLGNLSTPYLLVSEFKRAEGTYGYVAAKSILDPYRTLLTIRFNSATIGYAENKAYVQPMAITGQVAHDCITQYTMPTQNLPSRSFAKIWHQLKLFTFMDRYMTTQCSSWQRKATLWRSREDTEKQDDASHIGADFMQLEYAKDQKLLEARTIDVSYYCDALGYIPTDVKAAKDHANFSNGYTDPEWGIDIVIYAGLIKYGPWADRQRVDLQRFFFPASWQDVQVSPGLKPGDQRRWTAAQLLVELRDCTNIQIPFREASKDWQWDGKCEVPNRPHKREPACIQVTAGDCSSIRLTIPMIVGNNGYEGTLEVHLDAPTVMSSLNDVRLIRAETCRVRCGMPTPLRWNDERTWQISVTLRDPILHLVRDYINMFIDLGKDWAYGAPHDYRRFIPTVYDVDFTMHHYTLNMYLNDNNILEKPHIKDENVLFTTSASYLRSKVIIPSNIFRAERTNVSFVIDVPDPFIQLSLPRWNTNALHAPKDGNTLGRAASIQMEGSYLYFAQVKEDNVEQLQLKITSRDVVFKALGWSIRYFMVLKDNYFGSFTHFSTLSEFLKRRDEGLPFGDPIQLKYRPGKANMLQITLTVNFNAGTIIIPAGLPGHESASQWDTSGQHGIGACLALCVPELQLHLRLHDYFMEMTLNTDTLSGYIEPDYPERLTTPRRTRASGQDLLLIDGIDIAAHRLFGPLPRTAAFICIWEIHIGQVRTILSASDATILAAAGNAFRINFTDIANAPSSEFLPCIEPDVTVLKFSAKGFDATWQTDFAAFSVVMPKGLVIDTNDIGSQYHQRVTSVRIPDINLRLLMRGRKERSPWLEAGGMETHVALDLYAAPRNHRTHTRRQIAFIQEQGRLSGRAQGMFRRYLRPLDLHHQVRSHVNGVFLPLPIIPNISHETDSREAMASLKARPDADGARPSGSNRSSDSEMETGISEAERDARLAKTRTTTPLPQVIDEEESMTSGDESDNVDLTDSSSNCFWSDEDNSDASEAEGPLQMLYSPICRRFKSLQRPATIWEGSPFTLVKDRIFSLESCAAAVTVPVNETPENVMKDCDDCDVVTLRIHFTRKSEFRLTPLIIPAMTLLEEDMERCLLRPELWIDSLLIKRLDEFLAYKESPSRFNWTVQLTCAVLQVGQHITMMDDSHPAISFDFESLTSASNHDHMAIFEMILGNFSTSGTMKSGDPLTFRSNFASLLISMKITRDRSIIPTSPPGEPSFEMKLANSSCSKGKAINVDLGCIEFSIGQCAPEFALAAGLSFARTAKQAEGILRRWKDFADMSQRITVYSILMASKDIPIVEPLSTIQPSYFVQRGVPSNVRADPRFKFLFHLRDCIRNLGSDQKMSMRSIMLVDDASLRDELEARMRALDPDIPPTSMEFLFYASSQNGGDNIRQYESDYNVSVRSRGATITVVGGLFSLSELRAKFRVVSCDVYRAALKNLSQASLRSEKRVLARKTITSLIFGDVTLTLFPQAMTFLQRVARLGPSLLGEERASSRSNHAKRQPRFLKMETTIVLDRLRVQAAAENLIFELGMSQMQAARSSLSKAQEHRDQSTNNTVIMGNAYIRARSPQTAHLDRQDILAALEFAGTKLNIVTRQEPRSRTRMRLVFSSDDSQVNVPRSALRLYRFIEEWRDDYLPGLESALRSLLSELRRSKNSAPTSFARPGMIQLHGKLAHLGVALRVMHGTWVSWNVHDLVGYCCSANTSSAGAYTFGSKISSMAFSVSTKEAMQVKMALPPFTITGRYDGLSVHLLALVDFIVLKIKPVHWDKLLVIQQKFGQDFNDLLSLMQETRLRRTMSTAQASGRRENRLKYGGYLKMQGFRIGLEGMASTLYLECQDIGSGMDSVADNAWHVALSNLALSLAPRSGSGLHGPAFNRRHRSAFVIIDIMISTESRTPQASLDVEKRLRIAVTKIHAVMKASSISKMSDFVDELHTEVLSRKDQRSLELAAFKEKARTILKTFEVGSKDSSPKQTSPWLDTYVIDIVVQDVGLAIPLTHGHDLQLPEKRAQDTAAVRAFLFSIAKVEFGVHRGATGQAAMTNLSFQFVPRQSVANDFLGENHQTRNRLLYPEMRARIQTSQTLPLRQMWMGGTVSGFILDFDSSIPEYIFSAIDVYHRGKESVERISATVPRPQWSPAHSPLLRPRVEDWASSTSRIFSSLKFSSGKIRLFSEQAYSATRFLFSNAAPKEVTDEQLQRYGVEVFNLPEVSVWVEYRTSPAHTLTTPNAEPSTVLFKSTVHSSENVLRPTMLHFLTEAINSVETQLGNVNHSKASRPLVKEGSFAVIPQSDEIIPANLGLQISFSLRIDRSRLELTCLPDVNVMAGLHWESGGFAVNIFPAAQKMTFTGAVGGLTAGLKHGFLSEDCVRLDARNLTLTVTFARLRDHLSQDINLLSVVLDTEFLGGLRFSRLQDVLCFKAVWLDNIPILKSQASPPSRAVKTASTSSSKPLNQTFTTAVLVRIRNIQADVDLGQSISAVTLDLSNVILHTELSDSLRELSISVQEFKLNAKGNISGCMRVEDCVFQTSQRMDDNFLEQSRMLDLRMTSGPVSVDLQSEHQKLLLYRAYPLAIEIYDDWSNLQLQSDEQPLQLSFTVACSEIFAVATAGSIPRLMTYANRFETNLQAQREGASRESTAFSRSRTPKVGNPLSTVAEAMLRSAKSRLKQAESTLTYLIRQHMSFRLNRLQLVVFPRMMEDTELASFVGGKLRARLSRTVASGNVPPHRNLFLSFSSLGISRYAQIIHRLAYNDSQAHEWLDTLLNNATEATIIGLPAMRMRMISEEALGRKPRTLMYDFNSNFIRHDGARQEQEDIFITLNMSLYSWLTVLRKNLAREMEQVRNAAERQSAKAKSLSTASQRVPNIGEGSAPEDVDTSGKIGSEDGPSQKRPQSPTPFLPSTGPGSQGEVLYVPRSRHIERLKMRQLGEATPDVMHPFFMKKSGFNLEDSLPQYVNEYATTPLEGIMEVLLKLYSRQIPSRRR